METNFKAFLLFTVLSASIAVSMGQEKVSQKQGENEHIMLNEKEIQWKEAPSSLPKGAQIAVIEGDPTKEGPFTMRIKLPANYQIKPHWHPVIEHVTVLEGTFYMGSGEQFDMNTAMMLTENGFATMPQKYIHYAFTKDQESVIQLHGIGPWGITYVNEADDPRNEVRTSK